MIRVISWLITVIGLLTSWYFTDLDSDSMLQSGICPVFVAIFLAVFIVKFALIFVTEKPQTYTEGEEKPFIGKIDGG